MDKFLKWFIRIWVALIILLALFGYIEFYIRHQSFWETVIYILGSFSPFDGKNLLGTIILFSPAIGAYYWRIKRTRSKYFKFLDHITYDLYIKWWSYWMELFESDKNDNFLPAIKKRIWLRAIYYFVPFLIPIIYLLFVVWYWFYRFIMFFIGLVWA